MQKSKDYRIEERNGGRCYSVVFNQKNRKGDSLELIIEHADTAPELKNGAGRTWKRLGYTKSVIKEFWSVLTYATDKDGQCWGRYNPQHKILKDEYGTRLVLNFDYVLDGCTAENMETLIRATAKRFFAC